MSQALKDELTNDPLTRGYSGMTDQEVVDSLYTINRTRNRVSMTGRAVRNTVNETEYAALAVDKQSQFLALTATDDIDPFGFAVGVVKDIFGPGATSVSNLATARVESISRAVELGLGTIDVKYFRLNGVR